RMFSLHLIRPPPPSPLFPYTTLFRSALAAVPQSRFVSYRLPSTDHEAVVITVNHQGAAQHVYVHPYSLAVLKVSSVDEQLIEIRSEEHTSELQSRENLVCRLLLEKKN